MINKIHTPTLVLVASLLATACASPSASRPDSQLLDPLTFGQQRQAQPPAIAQGRWWQALGQGELDHLIDSALASHPSLTAAQARVRAAGATVALNAAQAGPQLDLNGSVGRARTSEYGLLPPPIAGNWHTLNNLSLDLGWRLDLWGQIRAQTASAQARELAARLEAEQTRQWLASAIVAQYLELSHSRQRVRLLQQDLRLAKQQTGYSHALQRAGMTSADPQDAAQAAEKLVAARLASAQALSAQASHALAALSAQPQSRIDKLPTPALPEWTLQTAQLTTRALSARPDLRAAIAGVHAADNSMQAAKAAFYPDITLGAFAGLQAQNTSDLFSRGALAAGVLPGITLPLFHAGALNAALDAQTAGYDAAVAHYNLTLLAAVQEAADGVSNTQNAQQAYRQAQDTYSAMQRIAQRSQTRAKLGLEAPTQAVSATRQALAAQHELIAAHSRVLLAQSQLMRALAGAQTL